jgi:hypothetical protein
VQGDEPVQGVLNPGFCGGEVALGGARQAGAGAIRGGAAQLHEELGRVAQQAPEDRAELA